MHRMPTRLLPLGLLWMLVACGDSGTPPPEGPDTPLPPEPERVTVGHARELRGVWVSTVLRLDWPPAEGMTPEAGRASLDSLVDEMAGLGLNALFFQVRPESDALYASTLEPWSRFLSGTQGTDPGWDPLEHLVNAAHARGLEVHAWVNPYRALMSTTVVAAPDHVSQRLPAAAVTYNKAVVMNPGEPEVRQHVKAVVKDLLGRYDVDGLIFDDYFYPYPDAQQTPFPDTATYERYRATGGTLEKGDWRRENVNVLIREVMATIVSEHPHVRFGVSPFGIWKSGVPVPGLDAYSAISCDAVTWMNQGWVDYLAPQLYWRETSAQSYSKLSSWWANGLVGGRHLFPAHAVHHLTSAQDWPLAELEAQVAFTRTLRGLGALGDIHFRSMFLSNDGKGVKALFRDTLYAKPALPPLVPRMGAALIPPEPVVAQEGLTVRVSSPQPPAVRFHLLYREATPGEWELVRVAGGAEARFEVSSGSWAVSAVGRGGAESQGVRFTVP